MKRVPVGLLSIAILVAWAIPHFSASLVGQAPSASSSSYRRGRAPPVREGYRLAEGPGRVEDRIRFCSHRRQRRSRVGPQSPRITSLSRSRRRAAKQAGPPVMEFDKPAISSRAGAESGPGYQWPSNEHGITVDAKGFVWIVGNADGTRTIRPIFRTTTRCSSSRRTASS